MGKKSANTWFYYLLGRKVFLKKIIKSLLNAEGNGENDQILLS